MDVCLLARPDCCNAGYSIFVPEEIRRKSGLSASTSNINSLFYYNMYHIVQFDGGGFQVLHDLLV